MAKKPQKIERAYKPERVAFERAVDHSEFYNSWTWRKTSRAYRSANPICECNDCKTDEVVRPAQVCDHVRGLQFLLDNNISPYDWDELQSMSSECHNKKSGSESHRFRRGMGSDH